MAASRNDTTATLDPNDYAVVWIAPLEIEAKAALCLLDERHHGRFPVDRGDEYVFHAGSMCGHNVVIATFPAGQEYGTASAAALASQILKCFPNLWFGLLVGVAAGLPDLASSPPRDIRLGDVLVSLPEGERPGVIAYDLGKETDGGFQPLRYGHVLTTTKPIVRSAIGRIKLEAPDEAATFLPYYETIRDREHATGTFADPGQDHDTLYSATEGRPDIAIERPRRPDTARTRVWYGPIGSGDKLLKNAQKRNELRDKYGVIGLEMEAAGTMNRIPVGVIRGVCDYGDQQKNKEWQPYAAAIAAAYGKAVLNEIPSTEKRSRTDGIARTKGVNEPTPPCYYIQLPKNARFTGRDTVLDALDEALSNREEIRRVALVGLGGIGKTQIALRFAYNTKESRPDYSIFWVPVLSHGSVEQAYVEIAKKLGVRKQSDDEDIKDLVCQYLSSDKNGNWLFVVDNADDGELFFGTDDKTGIEAYLPESENGLVLLTTRSRQVAAQFAEANIVDIEQMDTKDATLLFQKSLAQRHTAPDEVGELLAQLAYLPLAITQAAAYLNQTKVPIGKYLGFLRGAEKDAVRVFGREFRDSTRYRQSHNAVATTWVVSFEQIRKSDQTAVDMLSFMACVEPKAIPQWILPESESEETEWAIGVLCGYSFLVRRGDDDTFDMHSLVHMATREWVKKQGWQQRVVRDAIGHLTDIFPSHDPENRKRWRECTPHAVRLLHDTRALEIDVRFELVFSVGRCMHTDRRFKEATQHFEELWRWANQRHTGLLETTIRRWLAAAYLDGRRIKEAIEILEHIVEEWRRTRDEKDYDRLASEHELARAYLEGGRTSKAIEMLEHIVAVKRQIRDEKDYSRLVSESVLARAYLDDQRVKEAIDIFEHVVAVGREILDEKDHSRLTSEHSLAKAYIDDRRVKEAIEIFEHVVAVEREILDERDHSRLTSEHELARAYLADQRIEEAIQILQHVVAVEREILDEKDYDRLVSERELAKAYLDDRRVKEAIEIFEHVVAVEREILDERDHSRLTSEHELARAYLADQRIEEAIQILQHVVAVEAQLYAEDNPDRLLSIRLLEDAYKELQLCN
ncbi:uncharacterized protein B0I36DRAFT_284513 [Microdochium trichocladiopsis]|uniref:NB-ARC domain-containing protein n=1 Tax=Microdochium trichocladiopsis TaxID=1682393 RepID=A0A9P8YG58_9PEZI|nr:uncharacterized protein B0I36DRAFT_284513 [Microdochium trichocladiopsis]KAH7038361.1 hypothetical protein B0I36DRAFT_284513 [Microdochium trichocladiopsis]